VGLRDYERDHGGGNIDPEDAYDQAVQIGRPWQRAKLLASRIIDDALRTNVQATIDLAYPFHFREVSRMLGGFPHSYGEYPFDQALASVAEATEAIGGRLRQPAIARRRA
jgi:hypothetical protein